MLVKFTHAGVQGKFQEFRSTPVATIYTKMAQRVKLPAAAILVLHGDSLLDPEDSSVIGDLTPNPAVELVVRTDVIALAVSFGTETWNTVVLRSTTNAEVYRKVAQRFKREAGSFAIEVLRRPFPDTEVALEVQFPANFTALALDVSTVLFCLVLYLLFFELYFSF
jgi:hypothetical protein